MTTQRKLTKNQLWVLHTIAIDCDPLKSQQSTVFTLWNRGLVGFDWNIAKAVSGYYITDAGREALKQVDKPKPAAKRVLPYRVESRVRATATRPLGAWMRHGNLFATLDAAQKKVDRLKEILAGGDFEHDFRILNCVDYDDNRIVWEEKACA